MVRLVILGRRMLTRAGVFGLVVLFAMGLPLGPQHAVAAPALNQPAPPFTGTDSKGNAVSLADFRGSIVVLEWTNHDCPFVRRHYESGNMQRLQEQAAGAGVVWLTVVSSAPGEQGFVDGKEADALTKTRGAAPRAVIFDPSGEIGHAYAARTTPNMFVIDASGTLVYMGAIDNEPRVAGTDPAGAQNYVRDALEALAEGTPIATSVTQPYGCSIKYKS